MTPTLIITRDTRPGSSRQWLLATQRLEGRIDFDAAAAIRRQIVADLQAQGWHITGYSEGSRFEQRGADFTGMQIEVDAQRGKGPRTAYENHMIATCTGRD